MTGIMSVYIIVSSAMCVSVPHFVNILAGEQNVVRNNIDQKKAR